MIILGWVVLSIVSGVIASNRGRSGLGYFLLSIVLSPLIGILIAFSVSPDIGAFEREKLHYGQAKKCPYCAEIIKPDAKVCRFCGRDQVADESKPLVMKPESVILSEPEKSEKAFLQVTKVADSKSIRSLMDKVVFSLVLLVVIVGSTWAQYGDRLFPPKPYVEQWTSRPDVDISRTLESNSVEACDRYESLYLGHYEYSVRCTANGKPVTTYTVDTYYKTVKP